MTIFLEDSFDAAHFLPNVPMGHKCRTMHGHTYRIRIEVTGEVDPTLGWVMDYAAIKEVWLNIKSELDHMNLNDSFKNPTCEKIVAWIGNELKDEIPGTSRVELRETVNCGVVYIP